MKWSHNGVKLDMTYVASLVNHNTIGVHRGQAHQSMIKIAENAAKQFRDKQQQASPYPFLQLPWILRALQY